MADLPVDVLWIARYDYCAGWSLRPHHHNYFQMILFLDGKGTFTVTGRPFALRGGELFLIKPGETHRLSAESMVRTLDVKFRVTPGPFERRLRRAASTLSWTGPSLAARLERIRLEGDRKHQWYRELCAVLLSEILYLYLRRGADSPVDALATPAEPGPHDSVMQRAMAHLRAQSHRPLSVREIAQASGCTDRTLRLHFQRTLQTSPLEFLQRHRIAQAKELIQYSDYTLKEIAGQTGFQTVHHFTRLFTAIEGRSPAVWRRQYLEGIQKDVYVNPRFSNRSFTVKR
jgi:AraC family L-rhamnose operon transcriptional activator RhaR